MPTSELLRLPKDVRLTLQYQLEAAASAVAEAANIACSAAPGAGHRLGRMADILNSYALQIEASWPREKEESPCSSD